MMDVLNCLGLENSQFILVNSIISFVLIIAILIGLIILVFVKIGNVTIFFCGNKVLDKGNCLDKIGAIWKEKGVDRIFFLIILSIGGFYLNCKLLELEKCQFIFILFMIVCIFMFLIGVISMFCKKSREIIKQDGFIPLEIIISIIVFIIPFLLDLIR